MTPQGDKVQAALSGNKALAVSLSAWAFGERGVVRVRSVTHHRQGDKETTNTYTITDTVVSAYYWSSKEYEYIVILQSYSCFNLIFGFCSINNSRGRQCYYDVYLL